MSIQCALRCPLIDIPWQELISEIASVLVEAGMPIAQQHGIPIERVRAAARRLAAEVVEIEVAPITRKIIRELTLSAISNGATREQLEQRI